MSAILDVKQSIGYAIEANPGCARELIGQSPPYATNRAAAHISGRVYHLTALPMAVVDTVVNAVKTVFAVLAFLVTFGQSEVARQTLKDSFKHLAVSFMMDGAHLIGLFSLTIAGRISQAAVKLAYE
jgi:hypothetical protein